ncbi:MAG: hypothetical protein Edafosvirus6_48 [Edafosvirus sp.]|uniref:Uncharacterized protein n=1 Tax=Edafosvirus sp. TaxID=2487765 RepID=A0A3G4ZXQ2_9VIRU|nr:MAG: hypothetical protein Edafosvirus6_48 [Edafosvirus sp.]
MNYCDLLEKDKFISALENKNIIEIHISLDPDIKVIKDFFNVTILCENHNIKKSINLYGYNDIISYEIIETLDDFLKQHKMIIKIALRCVEMDLNCSERFNKLLINNNHIVELEFIDNIKLSYETILENIPLQKLKVYSPNSIEMSKILLFPLIESLNIHLDCNEFDERYYNKQLQNAFRNTKSLTDIYIDNSFENKNRKFNKIIVSFLKSKNQSVKNFSIHLEKKFSKKKLHEEIMEYIQQNKNIKTFSISDSISNYDFLNKNDTIEELKIFNDKMYDDTIKSLENLILENKKIIKLEIGNIPNVRQCKILIRAIKKNGTIEKLSALYGEINNEWKNLLKEVEDIKKLKRQHILKYLDLFASYQILPMISIIDEYVGLNIK